jgi:tetratricopeptide (TPR) repeat protein
MALMPQRFPIPTNDDDFERMCLQLMRSYWSRPGLELFGKRGERQYGIDILDLGGEMPIYAAQCKLKEEHKSLPPAEIQAEVDKAKQFAPPLGRYAILTTAKVSTQAQRKVREINQLHKKSGLFEVEILTWEILCSLLQQFPEVREHFYGEIALGRATRIERGIIAIREGIESLTSKSDGDEIDSEINDARDWITKREFQVATLLLNRIRRKKEHKLTDRQKFRVLSNLGAATLGLAKVESAAKLFLEALDCQPKDEQGRVNEVLAYFLMGDMGTSHGKAEVLRAEYPGSSRLASLWLMTAPRNVSLGALESQISSILQADPEVSVALARRALMEFAFDKASEYAASAAKAAPDWAQPHLVLATVDLGRALHVQLGFQVETSFQEKTLLDAEQACSRALELAREAKDGQVEKEALVLRVDIRLLLKKTNEATQDAEAAERLDPEFPHALVALAQTRFATKRSDDGISILRKAYRLHPRPDVAFSYGRALCNREQETDLDDALNVLVAIPLQDLPQELRPTTASQTMQCFAKLKRWTQAQSYLAGVADLLDPIVLKIMQGYLAHYQGDPQRAESLASEAHSLLSAKVNADTKAYLAELFMLLGRPASALPLWQDLFEVGAPAFDPGNLLNCAAKLHRDDLVMQVCDRLHQVGRDDWNLVDFETRYLEKYNIEAAIDRLKWFLGRHPGHRLCMLRLSLIGLPLGRRDLVHSKMEELPPVDELPSQYALAAVQVLKYGGNPNDAVEYAYSFLRTHFAEIEAHQALLVSMMPGSCAPDLPPVLEVVGPNAAVCYEELPLGHPNWVVLQETDRPNGDFEEIPLTAPLAAELTGKRVGDAFVLAKGMLHDRTARILQILPKYVRRFQDSAGEMQVRFGPASVVESIHVEVPEPGGRSEGIEVILASVEKQAAAAASARDMYNNSPVSLHWYGSRFGRGAFEALVGLVHEGQPIKCCFGNAVERSQGDQALQSANTVVVDMTALATLRLLKLEKVLSSAKYRFVASERAWLTLRNRLFNERVFSGAGGTMVFQDGRHVLYEETAEDKEHRNQEDEEFVRFVEKATIIRSGAALAAIEPSKRDALEKLFGPDGAESMVLASDAGCVLWTDDLIAAQIAAQEFGVCRVWTQLVLGNMADAGLVTPEEYSDASARLVGMQFMVTMFDSSSVFAAIRLAGWSAAASPAAQILKVFSDPSTDLPSLLRIFVGFVVRLFREPLTAEARCEITRAFLDALAGRPNALAQLRSLRALSSRVFGLNVVGKDQFDTCFDSWLRGGPLGIVG